MRAIIVDDEKGCRSDLSEKLQEHLEDVQVVGFGKNVAEGIEQIRELQPDLIFLDVEMPDGTGFQLLEETQDQGFRVIFTTAFDRYALRAIKFGALDYLLKPIDKEELGQTIRKVSSQWRKDASQEQYQLLLDNLQTLVRENLPSRLAIRSSEGVHYKWVKDIIRFEGSRNYTTIFLDTPERSLLASLNLGEFEQQFELYPQFIRIHKSHMVNLHYLDTYVKADGGYLLLTNGEKISVSRMYRQQLLRRLEKL